MKYGLFVRLCRVVQSNQELRPVFQQAAEQLHEFTGCARVRLIFASSDSPWPPGLAIDFSQVPACVEIAAQNAKSPALEGAFVHRQAQIVRPQNPADKQGPGEQHYESLAYLPLLCGGKVFGVLELAARQANQFDGWDLKELEGIGTLVALALDNLEVHARLAELQRFQRESAYLRDEIKADRDLRLLTGESPAMKAVRVAIQQVARTDGPWRDRHRQGTGRPGYSPGQSTPRPFAGHRQLRCAGPGRHRERIIRP
jgi:formate hydrogenlyase transcriptional activator